MACGAASAHANPLLSLIPDYFFFRSIPDYFGAAQGGQVHQRDPEQDEVSDTWTKMRSTKHAQVTREAHPRLFLG
jgi:hypothetical protein